MAGAKNLLKQLAQKARELDEAALEAFASKGLLRRAKKDYATRDAAHPENQIVLEFADEKQINLRVAEAVVTVSEKGLTQAVCDCPSTEVCRHVLIVCFWLAEQNFEENGQSMIDTNQTIETLNIEPIQKPENSFSFQNLLEITLSQFEKAVGKRLFAQGAEFLQKNSSFEITNQSSAVKIVQFFESNITVRLFAGADVNGHLCSCRSNEACRHKIAAVLAFRKENKVEYSNSAQPEKAESSAVQTLSPAQIKVLQKTQKLTGEFVEIGCAHLSAAAVEQLQTLATSAGGASLFRLSFMLKSMADNLNLSLKRSAQADETAWFLSLAKTYALVSALLSAAKSNPQLIGVLRSSYEQMGQLELTGVGAYQWQTPSGFQGLTILFWDNRAKRFFSWTDARPISDKGFTPLGAFTNEMRWQNVLTPAQAASSHLKLQNAESNEHNRLSGSSQIRAFVEGKTEIEKLDFASIDFSLWKNLREYFAQNFPVGLRQRERLKEFVVVRPRKFGNRFFDQVTQTFVWQFEDESKEIIELKIAFNAKNESAIEILEKIDLVKDKIEGILVRITFGVRELYLQPISLFLKPQSKFLSAFFRENKTDSIQILHLNLSNKNESKIEDQNSRKEEYLNEAESEENDLYEDFQALDITAQKLLETREILQNTAQSGTNSIPVSVLEKLLLLAKSFDSLGLTHISKSIAIFVNSPQNELPTGLVKLVFLTQLSLEIAQVRSFTK